MIQRIRVLALYAVGLAIVQPAHAYLDPGTGSIILQSLIAGIAAAALIIKTYWYRIVGYWNRLTNRSTNDIGESPTNEKDPETPK